MLFSAWCLKNNIYLVVFYLLTKSFFWLPLICEMLGYICIVIIFNQVVASYFSYQAFFSIWPKSQNKSLNILRIERASKMKKSIFHNLWRTFIEANKTDFFGRWEPDFKVCFLGLKFKRYRGCLLFDTLLKTESFLY